MPQRVDDADAPLSQCGALCWRENGPDIEVLLLTSRDTGRWVIPKGWPMAGKTLAEAAAQEAWEEAGVRGVVHPVPVGSYQYAKSELTREIEVAVFSLRIETVARKFPERKQLRRAWLSPAEAAARVVEPDLAALIVDFI